MNQMRRNNENVGNKWTCILSILNMNYVNSIFNMYIIHSRLSIFLTFLNAYIPGT